MITNLPSRFATRDQTMMLAIIATTTIQPYDEILVTKAASKFAVSKPGVIPAKRIQFSVRTNHMRAAAVDAIFVPRKRVHERLDEQPKRMRFIQLESFQQLPQRL